jgi:adenylate cyclase
MLQWQWSVRAMAVAEQRPQRQLSAILAADIAGYSRLIGLDEEGTLVRLKELRRTLIDPRTNEHRRRIVKTMGDGLLVQFASAVDAMRCAIEYSAKWRNRTVELTRTRELSSALGSTLAML